MAWSMERKFALLAGLYIAALVAANLVGNKVAVIGGIVVSVAIFSYPVTFLVTDIVAEVFGKKKTTDLVLAGVASLVFVLLLTALSVALPPADRFPYNEAYTDIFGMSTRILIASIICFAASQTHDIWAFHFWKEKTHGKHLWLRNNLSTMGSQLIDSFAFIFIAFYGAAPEYTLAFVVSITIPYWLVKVVVAAVDTPFCYLGVRWMRGNDTIGSNP
ncbi:MAG: queuosine precursor transporter [Methanofollis sp.]|nr:queuosine precursor transporter [Methanofollis sp.]